MIDALLAHFERAKNNKAFWAGFEAKRTDSTTASSSCGAVAPAQVDAAEGVVDTAGTPLDAAETEVTPGAPVALPPVTPAGAASSTAGEEPKVAAF